MPDTPQTIRLIRSLSESVGGDTQTLRTLLDLLPVGVAIAHDRECKDISFNQAAIELFGLTTNATIADSDLPFHLKQDGRILREDEMPMHRAVTTGEELREIELELCRDDGTTLNLYEYASPLKNGSGQIVGCIAVYVDITARRRSDEILEQQIAERTSHAQHRADQLRDLALALADAEARERKRLAERLHDGFQQFLSAARLKAALVRRKLDPEMAEGVLQVERMLEQAIDESRTLTNELSPPVLYDAGLVPAVEALARNFERQRGIKLTVDVDANAEPEEEQVRVLLFEAVRELLSNIASHSKAKSAHIKIGLSSDNHIDVTVSDDGIGLDPAAVETAGRRHKLFGLMEIRERLKYIGGGMRLDSAPGEGTDVTLFVPTELRKNTIESDDSAKPQAAIQAPAKSPCKPIPHDRWRIVVADDHAIFREGLINMLSQDPELHVIGEAADGEEAVKLVKKLRPDILIVDVTMPKMSGIAVTAQLSKEFPEMKIVGLSMHEREDMADAMRSAGAMAYVTKGGSSESLLALLRELSAGTAPATTA